MNMRSAWPKKERTNMNVNDLKLVLEAFWEYSDSDGSSIDEKEAAIRLQKEAGFTTTYDAARERQTAKQRALWDAPDKPAGHFLIDKGGVQ